jgi:hypothetical protein
MKIFRWSAMALVAAAGLSIGCSTGGCNGTNLNESSKNSNDSGVSCGTGTEQRGDVCVPVGTLGGH